ncbi:DUF4181 domain-containing protein [Aquibacillus rhizosphaerae]|uniref:DUF4181 domain-containing protein n=1 Tax=Aquibacillus rhizosphaerae TaxID=3051431 RepID=UPI0038B28A03
MKDKFATPKRNCWYKHERKDFAILFYIVVIIYLLSVLIYQESFFFLFPFFLSLVNILFGIEKYICNKDNKMYLHFFIDSFFWCLAGIIAVTLLV